jgi:hypothetical protein
MSHHKSNIASHILLIVSFTFFFLVLVVVLDPQYHREKDVSGTIIGNIQQVGEGKNPEEHVQVKLKNGAVVNAIVSPVSGFPYDVGTPVSITPYRSMLFGKHTYRAYVGSALTTQ